MYFLVKKVCENEFLTFLRSVEKKLEDDIWFDGMDETEWDRGEFIDEGDVPKLIRDFLEGVIEEHDSGVSIALRTFMSSRLKENQLMEMRNDLN